MLEFGESLVTPKHFYCLGKMLVMPFNRADIINTEMCTELFLIPSVVNHIGYRYSSRGLKWRIKCLLRVRRWGFRYTAFCDGAKTWEGLNSFSTWALWSNNHWLMPHGSEHSNKSTVLYDAQVYVNFKNHIKSLTCAHSRRIRKDLWGDEVDCCVLKLFQCFIWWDFLRLYSATDTLW